MDVNPIELKVGTSNYSETDDTLTDHTQPVTGRNVARKKTSMPPYNSYLSEINAKPMDPEIPSVRQFPSTKNERLLIPALDGDDEVCIWIENPVVIDLTSDGETSFKNDSRHEKMAHLEITLSDNMKNEIIDISDVDEDDPKCCPSKNPVDTVMASSSEGKSCSALPESDKILITPSVNATATGGTRTESADFKCKITTEPAILVVHSLQSLDQAPQMPEPLRSTRTLPVERLSLEYVSPQQHAVFPTWQSEPHDMGSRHNDRRSKKRNLSPERCNNARSGNTKLFNPMRGKERNTRRHCNEAYELLGQSQSAAHSNYPIFTSPHQRASVKYGNAMDEYADSNSEIRPTSSRVQTQNYGDENGNGTNQMKKHSPRSENHQSSRSRVDDQFYSYESSQLSRIRSPTYRGTTDNGRISARYRGRYSDVAQTFTSWNGFMNGSYTSSATQIYKRFESPNNRWHSRKSENNKWEAISLKKETCRLILSNAFDFLSDAYKTYRVQVRVDWTKRGNILWISGTKADRRRFKHDFVKFNELQTGSEGVEAPASAGNEFKQQSSANNVFEPSILIESSEDDAEDAETMLMNL